MCEMWVMFDPHGSPADNKAGHGSRVFKPH
jgi:hypothetical protein